MTRPPLRVQTQGRRRSVGEALRRRGFATLIVLFAMGVSTAVLIGLQGTALRQASAGREAVARVRAYWAARAGVEAAIARVAFNIESDSGSATQTMLDLQDVAGGVLGGGGRGTGGGGARWLCTRLEGEEEKIGAADAHAKLNINRMSQADLMELPYMTEDIAASILDWIDPDDTPNEFGAEIGYYSQLPSPYEPRNAPFKSLRELELVAGVLPELVRGEDWNLNGVLDPNEDDGDMTFPPDDADGVLEPGWSGLITTESVDEGLARSGQTRLDLAAADSEQLIARFNFLDALQAQVIAAYAQDSSARMIDFINVPLRTMAANMGIQAPGIRELAVEEIAELLDEATLFDPADGPVPGRLNVNTCRRETLDYIEPFRTIAGAGLADMIILTRDSRPSGFVSIMDLLEVPGMSRNTLASLAQFIDVTSSAYVVSSRGRDINTGIEVEIVATIERTAQPVVISEMIVR